MSERSGKILLGLVLLLIGGLVLLDQLGIDGGDILGLLIPGVIMLYGARKVMGSTGSRFWGVLIFLFGFLMLIGKLHLLFQSILAIGVIYLGYRLLRQRDVSKEAPPAWQRKWAKQVLQEDTALDKWEQSVISRQQ